MYKDLIIVLLILVRSIEHCITDESSNRHRSFHYDDLIMLRHLVMTFIHSLEDYNEKVVRRVQRRELVEPTELW